MPVRREDLVIERNTIDRRLVDTAESQAADSLVEQLMERLRHMQPVQTLRIPINRKEVMVHKGPVVVEEITVGKRIVEETQKVSDTIRREEAHIEPHVDVPLHDAHPYGSHQSAPTTLLTMVTSRSPRALPSW